MKPPTPMCAPNAASSPTYGLGCARTLGVTSRCLPEVDLEGRARDTVGILSRMP